MGRSITLSILPRDNSYKKKKINEHLNSIYSATGVNISIPTEFEKHLSKVVAIIASPSFMNAFINKDNMLMRQIFETTSIPIKHIGDGDYIIFYSFTTQANIPMVRGKILTEKEVRLYVDEDYFKPEDRDRAISKLLE